MKITVIAADLPILAYYVAMGASTEDIAKSMEDLDIESPDFENLITNQSLSRFIWIKFEKTEETLNLVNTALMMSAGNTHSFTDRSVVLTENEVFINYSILKLIEDINEADDRIDVMIAAKKKTLIKDTSELFRKTSFSTLYINENDQPTMHIMTGVLSTDTWNVLRGIAQVSTRDTVLSSGDGTEKTPGFAIFFGTSMMTLMYLDGESAKFAKHIQEDFKSFPKVNKEK